MKRLKKHLVLRALNKTSKKLFYLTDDEIEEIIQTAFEAIEEGWALDEPCLKFKKNIETWCEENSMPVQDLLFVSVFLEKDIKVLPMLFATYPDLFAQKIESSDNMPRIYIEFAKRWRARNA